MSQVFSFSRLGKLITKQFFENSRLYWIAPLAMLGLLSIIFGLWIATSGSRFSEEGTYVIYFVGLYISGGIFASMSFNALSSKDKGIYWMSLPATHLEKLICTILFSTVFFTLLYTLIFWIVKTICVAFILNYAKTHTEFIYSPVSASNTEFFEILRYFFYGYLAVQSLYLVGSIYFPRYSFIITTVIGSAVIFLFIFTLVQINHAVEGSWQLTKLVRLDQNSRLEYSVSKSVEETLKFLVKFIWAPVFWVVTWFRLKEKEI